MRYQWQRRTRSSMHLLIGLVAAAALVAASAPTAAHARSGSQGPHTLKVLHMNLCLSGQAKGCYAESNLNFALELIRRVQPTMVGLNEICFNHLQTLTDAVGAPKGAVAFVPVRKPNGDDPKYCNNGSEFGNALILKGGYSGKPHPEWYSDTEANGTQRAYVCASGSDLTGCVTHLAASEPKTALRQCKELMNGYAAERATVQPVVVAGDLNLAYSSDAPPEADVQECIPDGFFRRSNGHYLHVAATTNYQVVHQETFPEGEDNKPDHEPYVIQLQTR